MPTSTHPLFSTDRFHVYALQRAVPGQEGIPVVYQVFWKKNDFILPVVTAVVSEDMAPAPMILQGLMTFIDDPFDFVIELKAGLVNFHDRELRIDANWAIIDPSAVPRSAGSDQNLLRQATAG